MPALSRSSTSKFRGKDKMAAEVICADCGFGSIASLEIETCSALSLRERTAAAYA
jgi:hypothetical protein